MTKTLLILVLFSATAFCSYGQLDSIKSIDLYVLKVDSLLQDNKLSLVEYQAKSYCGGSLKGYYLDTELLFIASTDAAEIGYSSNNVYFKNGNAVKFVYHQHFAEWEKYSQMYPEGETDSDYPYESMTYADTTYIIYFSEPPQMTKNSKGEYIDGDIFKFCEKCSRSMKLELEGKTTEALELILSK